MFIWYAITFVIYFDMSFDFEMKRKKKQKNFITSRRKKSKKKVRFASTKNQMWAI